MFEAAAEIMPVIEDSSVNPNGEHVKALEQMADQSGVPKGEILADLDQQSDKHCTWENDLKNHDLKQGD